MMIDFVLLFVACLLFVPFLGLCIFGFNEFVDFICITTGLTDIKVMFIMLMVIIIISFIGSVVPMIKDEEDNDTDKYA